MHDEDMDVSMADAAGGYKNFVIESSPKQPPNSKHHEITSDEKTKEEARIS